MFFSDELNQIPQGDVLPFPGFPFPGFPASGLSFSRLPIQWHVEQRFDRQLALGWHKRSLFLRGKTRNDTSEQEKNKDARAAIATSLKYRES